MVEPIASRERRLAGRAPTPLIAVVAVVGLAMASTCAAAPEDGVAPCDEGYVVVVSEATHSDPEWGDVVAALLERHRHRRPLTATWKDSPDETIAALVASDARFACFVARPEEASREFVGKVHAIARTLDDDPYGDVLWGILTGFDAANALAIARTDRPLMVRRVTSGTELAMDRVVEGMWVSELERSRMVVKTAGGEAREVIGPDDTTAELAARLNDGVTDLFVTSGHATERDWQIGFRYRNGSFHSAAGNLWGQDRDGVRIPIDSRNPKVWLPVGNCLVGHIDGPDAMALAFMRAAGVRQMIGYTVPTWFGYGGWGLLDYFVEQPGRFTLCEAFHANHHALVHRLETRAAPQDERGLRFDRDVVAFYGDPAWEARMAPGRLAFEQVLSEQEGTWRLVITPLQGAASFAPVSANGSQRGGRPILQFLPRRIGAAEIMEGAQWHPIVSDDFILVPLPPAAHDGPVIIRFRAGEHRASGDRSTAASPQPIGQLGH